MSSESSQTMENASNCQDRESRGRGTSGLDLHPFFLQTLLHPSAPIYIAMFYKLLTSGHCFDEKDSLPIAFCDPVCL